MVNESPRLARSAGLTGYLDLARSLGLDPYRLAAAQGLPGACLTDPDLKVPAEAIGRLLETTARRTGVEDFGLRLAETRRLSNLGAIGLVAREQPTLRAAIESIVHYSWLQNEALIWRLEDAGDLTIMRLALAADRRAGRQATELTIGVTVRTVRSLLGDRWRPEAIVFQYAAPSDTTTHRRVLGVNPTFGGEFTGVVFERRDLAAPIVNADPETARQLQRYVDQLAVRRQADPAATARELVLALLPTGGCNVEKVAALMGIDRRTLHRRLGRQGQTFTALVEAARRDVTEAHLAAGDRTLTEIADLLGYSSLSAFSRWRRRWREESRRSA
ncbi:MAG TPA: AraC family transcriptional regulator ligand-binding domain-containing protein [Caulobacteraceae bacterium]|nr:AraC family transcriptional regulator ligand-binding domain-containing protein [Caulobacteraceae bacterium]